MASAPLELAATAPRRATRGVALAAVALLALRVAPVAGGQARRTEVAAAAAAISAEGLRRHVVVLGSDALEGRAPGTEGGQRAAAYLARQLLEMGLEPLGDDGSFLQQVPLLGSEALPASQLRVANRGAVATPALGDDYLLYTTGSQTWLPRPVPLVFVGYGIVAPEFDYNDYADVDVQGRAVVFVDGEPHSGDPAFFAGAQPTVYSSLETKVRTALARGAAASILVPTDDAWFGEGWQRRRLEFGHTELSLATALPRHLALVANPEGLAPVLFEHALFSLGRVREMVSTNTMRSFHLTATVSFEGRFRERTFLAPNVVGRIPGTGRHGDRTAVVLSAHYDHLGRGPALDGDEIYNGVVDNAVGVAGVLEIARVLSQPAHRPERCVIVLLTTAEEWGNLGARYFLDHPPRPLPQLLADVNVDGLAFLEQPRNVIGVGAEQSSLGDALARAAGLVGAAVSRPPELWSQAAFVRSDQAAFADAGVPAILVAEGFDWVSTPYPASARREIEWLESRYHTPRDDLSQPLDWNAMRWHAGVVLALVREVTDAAVAPEWRPGVPYAYTRLLSRSRERSP